MKTDARTRYTLKVIKESFIKLLKENPVNKVTVKSLCDDAGINRATFYRYYEDVFDLYEKLKDEMVEEFLMNYDHSQPRDIESDFVYLLSKIKENAEVLRALSRQKDSYEIMMKMCRRNYRYFEDAIKTVSPEPSETEQIVTYYYISCGCTGVISEWILRGMKKDEKEVAGLLTKLFVNTIRNM